MEALNSSDSLSIFRIESKILFPENLTTEQFRVLKKNFLDQIKTLSIENQKLISNILQEKKLNISIISQSEGYNFQVQQSDKTPIANFLVNDGNNEGFDKFFNELKNYLFMPHLQDTQNALANLMGTISTKMDKYATSGLTIDSFQKDGTVFGAFFNKIRLLKNSRIGIEGLFDSSQDTKKFFDDLDSQITNSKVDRTSLPMALNKEELGKIDSIDNSIKQAVINRLNQTGKDKAILFRCFAPQGIVWISLTPDI